MWGSCIIWVLNSEVDEDGDGDVERWVACFD